MSTHALVFSRTALALLAAAIPLATADAGPAAAASPATQDKEQVIRLHPGRSQHLQSDWPVKGVSLTDPAVADVQVLTSQVIQVSGKSVGVTDVLMWSETGETRQLRVEVIADLQRLQAELSNLLPGCKVRVEQSQGVVVVAGVLERAEQARQLRSYLESLELAYVDITTIPGVQQVQVQVRIAEVSRSAIRTLGVNALKGGEDFFGGLTIGSDGGGPLNPVSIVPSGSALGNTPFNFTAPNFVSPSVTLFAGFPNSDLEVFLQALAENQYLRILAEPNLVALSGEEASFLAGGEFPIPVVQGGGGTGSNSVTIEYKQFGVRLKFRPTVLGEAGIRLQVASEVSDLTDIGAVTLQGFRVPGLVSRKADTTLELKSGQTFAMAGLISENTSARSTRVPMLGDLPVLGPLFRSIRYKTGETELLVLVTASLVEPLSQTAFPPLPGTEHVIPSEWEFYAEGRIEGRAPGRLSPEDSAWLREMGLHRLRGPGPWATHEQGPARSTAEPAKKKTAAAGASAAGASS